MTSTRVDKTSAGRSHREHDRVAEAARVTAAHGVAGGVVSRRAAFGLAGGAVATAALSAPAVAQTTIEWKMASAWPADLPGPGRSAQRICDMIATMSGGRMRVRLFPAGELVPAEQVFDAVASGTAQMGHSSAAYWQGRMPASIFFTSVPFGFLPHEHVTWIEQAGGQQLWNRLYEPFAVRPFMGGNNGAQMGTWVTRQIETVDDLEGLKIRMPGLGGEVMRRLGATPVSLSPAELVDGLSSGFIDAAEFLGAADDRALGFQNVTKLCYAPGFHEPNGVNEALVNTVAFEGLPEDLQSIVATACRAETLGSIAEADWRNSEALHLLTTEDGVDVRAFPADVLEALRTTTMEVLSSFDEDGIEREVLRGYFRCMVKVQPWVRTSVEWLLRGRS